MGRRKLQAIYLSAMALTALLIVIPANAAQKYTVKKGDSLWLIAKKCSVSIDSIKHANKVSAEKPLQIGKVLIIPGARPAASRDKWAAHNAKVMAAKAKANKTNASKVSASKPVQSNAPVQVASADIQQRISDMRVRVVRRALAYRGARYRRGASSDGVFDCSGFTRYVYMKDGIALPHSSRAQFNKGKPVSKSELQPGDLVFFATNRRVISHVGLYIGNGNFVHASTYSRGVRIDSLNSAYYTSRYRGARRIK
ncbi:MAG: peptidoglycan endopeptidase [Armatimonadota bacterium]|nr:peptidoglycan endopeptidase [Armatimonadota bacterium]